MLGFAMRAGRLIIGTELICRAMPRGEIKLVVLSSGASENTKKKLAVKSEYYGIRLIETSVSQEELGRILGKTYAPSAVAVTDTGFATEIEKAYV